MPSGTFSFLVNLPSASEAPLIAGVDGNLYGTTLNGGTFNSGAVFQLTTKGVLKVIYSFGTASNDGTSPTGALLQGSDGKLYGTTYWGGATGHGTVFQLAISGVYKILHNFTGTDGNNPASALVQGSDGFLYGVTGAGGALGFGAFFKIGTTARWLQCPSRF